MRQILRYVRHSELIENQDVGEELLAWLGFFGSEYNQEALCNCIDLALAAWQDTHPPGRSAAMEVKLFHAWSVMTREVDDALPWLIQLMKTEPSEHRSRILSLVELSMHPSSEQLLLLALTDPDLNLVTRGLLALSYWAGEKKANETERKELLEEVAAACRLAYPEKDKFPHLFEKEEPAFFEALEALLDKLLMNDSLEMFGPVAQDRLLNLYSVLPPTYVAPDDFTIEAILPHIETSTDKLANIVLASPLKPKHWGELLQKKSNDYGRKTELDYIKRLRERGDELLIEVLTLMIRSTKTKARAAGLHYLVTIAEYSEPTVVALVAQVAKQLGEPKGSVSEREAQLRLKVKRLFAKVQNNADADAEIASPIKLPSKSPRKSKKAKPPKESSSSAFSPASAPVPLASSQLHWAHQPRRFRRRANHRPKPPRFILDSV